MSEEPGFRSLGVLHPTFEIWGGAEWFIHQSLQALRDRFGVRSVIYTHRWRPPPGDSPGYQVVCHRRGGVRSGPWDWRRIARELAADWRRHDRLLLHNHPASLWHLEARRLGATPPAAWYCHEPPRHLYDEGAGQEPRRGRPSPGALRFYGSRAPWWLLGRARSALARRWMGRRAWREELRRRDAEAVGCVATILANSRYTAGRVREIYGREAEVVYPLPADLPSFAPPGGAAKQPWVLWVGRMTAAKRPRLLLEAWMGARARQPGLRSHRLILVGDGPERAALERRVADGAAADVRLRRDLPRGEMIELYRRALLTVHLGLAEPFGLVPVESMAAGTAVLVAGGGGVAETVDDGRTGWRVDELDLEGLTELLAALPGRREEVLEMGRRAAAHVRERFDPAGSLAALARSLERAGQAGR